MKYSIWIADGYLTMKKYKRILWFDLKRCFEDNKLIYLLAILLFLSAGIYFTKKTAAYGNAGIMDYYFNIISGIKKMDDSKIKEIPFVYIGFAVIFSYMTGRIMSYEGNISFIIKAKSRKTWLVMNLICLFANVVLIYLMAVIICFVFSDRNLLFNNNIFELYFKTDYCMQKFDNLFQVVTVL